MTKLLDEAIGAHGGLVRWRAIDRWVARLRFGGLAFASRGQLAGRRSRRVTVSLGQPRAVFEDFPRAGSRGVFTPREVWVERADGERLAVRGSPREQIQGFRRRLWWDRLDLLYFAGYALWNYLTVPFLLACEEVESEELEPWREGGELWRRLAVRFPASFPTHCREQTFYFDSEGLLRRHDYDPECYAPWARAAHYSSRFRCFDGIAFPTRRQVVPRRPDGTSRPGPTLVWIEIDDISAVRAGELPSG